MNTGDEAAWSDSSFLRLRCVSERVTIHIMRTNIVIDDELMEKAMRASGASTKREAVERALKLMVQMDAQARLIRSARGKLHWEGDLKAMRRNRPFLR